MTIKSVGFSKGYVHSADTDCLIPLVKSCRPLHESPTSAAMLEVELVGRLVLVVKTVPTFLL